VITSAAINFSCFCCRDKAGKRRNIKPVAKGVTNPLQPPSIFFKWGFWGEKKMKKIFQLNLDEGQKIFIAYI